MTVSIVIPTYNGARFVGETLTSVLNQTFDDFEVVVSDDGSSDETLDIVESVGDPRIRIVEDRSRVGAAGNWNRALSNASAPYVKLLPQDDIVYPGNLEAQVAVMQARPATSFVAVRRDVIGADGTVLLKDRGLSNLCGDVDLVSGSRRIVRSGGNQFGEGAGVLFRKDAATSVGSFDGSSGYVIDVDYWLRLLRWGPAYGLCETLAAFRVSAQAWSNVLVAEQGAQFSAFVDRLASERARGVTRGDVVVGRARARMNATMRRAFYVRYKSHL